MDFKDLLTVFYYPLMMIGYITNSGDVSNPRREGFDETPWRLKFIEHHAKTFTARYKATDEQLKLLEEAYLDYIWMKLTERELCIKRKNITDQNSTDYKDVDEKIIKHVENEDLYTIDLFTKLCRLNKSNKTTSSRLIGTLIQKVLEDFHLLFGHEYTTRVNRPIGI